MTVREFLEQVVRDNMYGCSNDGISLSLAKKNGDWLQEIDPGFLELRRGGVPNGVYEIMTDANNGQSNASVHLDSQVAQTADSVGFSFS
ncbi:hypothetical protein PRNP1_013036 [Phytophthora ramorum]